MFFQATIISNSSDAGINLRSSNKKYSLSKPFHITSNFWDYMQKIVQIRILPMNTITKNVFHGIYLDRR